ncbi:MAG: Crp/Fnr family transcriptional regulator [Pseudonocardiaceae bacterium]
MTTWPVLDVLSAEERAGLLAVARRRAFRRGDPVFHEGDPGDAVHLVAKGHVAVRRTLPTGDVGTLLILGAGDVFGELAIVSPAPRNATIVAIDAVETLAISGAVFDDVRGRFPAVDRILVHALAAEVRRLSALLMEALYLPAEARILVRLVELTRVFGGKTAGGPVVVPLTQEELAQLAGTARPTVNRVLRATEEAGELRIERGRIVVLDPAALLARASNDH